MSSADTDPDIVPSTDSASKADISVSSVVSTSSPKIHSVSLTSPDHSTTPSNTINTSTTATSGGASIKNILNTSSNGNSTPESSKPSSSGLSKRRRPPMLVLNGNNDTSSSPSNANFADVNLTSLNKNSATTTTTLSATPSSSIFPSIRTPKDVVLQDLALQCISPGLPTFPSVIRDAMVKSKSIQEAQRKIIAQRMKDNGGSFSQPLSGSDGKNSGNSDDDMDIDLEKSGDNIKSTSFSSSKSPSRAGLKNDESFDNDDKEVSLSNKLSDNADSLNSIKYNSSLSKSANGETSVSLNGTTDLASKKSFNNSDTDVPVIIDRPSKPATTNPPSLQNTLTEKDSALDASSKSTDTSLENPNKKIIQSGNIIIEAVPTPTLPSHPQFNKKQSSFMKPSNKRAPPPKGIKVTGFDSENPSIHSAPLYRGPAPFSPYSISKIPGYQAYYLNQALGESQGQAQTAGSNGVLTGTAQKPMQPFFSRNGTQQTGKGNQTSTTHNLHGYPQSATIMSPIYPTHSTANPNLASASMFGYAQTPTVATTPYNYARLPQVSQLPAAGQYPGVTNAKTVAATLSSAALGAPVNGLQPGLTSTAASNFYRDPRMVPLYVSGRPIIPPMTASAASWTGRTFRSHQFGKKFDDDDDDDDEDDGRDPEDAALSDDETDAPKDKKQNKRSSSNEDDLDDVEQKAISEEDERPLKAKKRRLKHSSSASNIHSYDKQVNQLTFTNGDMYDLATGVITGAAVPGLGALPHKSQHFFDAVGNSNGPRNIGSKTEEGLQQEELKKQRFLEICSEMWDLMRS